MTVSLIQPSFGAGELTPSLYGRVDIAKFHIGCATMRNFFVNYRGGASSRAGTKFVGASLQGGSGLPPRLIRFQYSLSQGIVLEFGNQYVKFIINGAYVTNAPLGITMITASSPAIVTTAFPHGFYNGQQVYIRGVFGTIQVNDQIFTANNVSTNTFELYDLWGNPVDTTTLTPYVVSGYASGVYVIGSPYHDYELPDIKFTQSADVMTFVHPNYPPYDLKRHADDNWTFGPIDFTAKIAAPTGLVGKASTTINGTILFCNVTNAGTGYTSPPNVTITSSTGNGAQLNATVAGGQIVAINVYQPGSKYASGDTVNIGGPGTGATATLDIGPSPVGPTIYQYVVTAVDKAGNESVASNIATITNSVNIGTVLGSIHLTWNPVAGAQYYRIYKGPATYNDTPPVGTLFGYCGTAMGNGFLDNNILQDFDTTPPLYQNPFAPGQIALVTMTNFGSGYTSDPAVHSSSSTGSGAVLLPVVVNSKVQAVFIQNAGQNYQDGDVITFSGGGGTGASGYITTSGYLPGTTTPGNYPSVVNYFQDRRVYANTLTQPDTYFMSQPGMFDNFDVAAIPLDDNAVIGAPWALQVNGIQQMIPAPTGMIMLAGLSAWLVNGGGGGVNPIPITPSNQQATQQSYTGCHNRLAPIQINFEVLFVQSKGSIVRDLSYNLWIQLYTGTDISLMSDHLFSGHQILEWAWAEEPDKLVWIVRDDGILLSLSFLKEQEVLGWARHDTRGLFKSVCSVVENVPTAYGSTFADITYFVVRRFINSRWMYYVERMDPRLWYSVEDAWCLDAALAIPQQFPNQTIQPWAAKGSGAISTTVRVVDGGSGYTRPGIVISDVQANGNGNGAVLTPVVSGGVITGVTVVNAGSGYVAPQATVIDDTGKGAVIALDVDNTVAITVADTSVFGVGNVIRANGGKAVITQIGAGYVLAQVIQPFLYTIQNDPNNLPMPAVAGTWSLSVPSNVINGLRHLEGQQVSALADGSVIENLTVTNGSVTLPSQASQVVIGLPYQCQLQSLNTDVPGEQTIQGKRKNIYTVTVRVAGSRGLKVGANQVDAMGGANTVWKNLVPFKERGNAIWADTAIPLFTGDERVHIPPSWQKGGRVAVQQDYPLPANVLAFIPEEVMGDTNG